jgi:DNA-binding SARP family transcriptional activator
MQVRLLGPVDIVVGGTARPVRGARRKALLAVLALRAGDIVSTDRLIEMVWGDSAPTTAAATLQNHISHLRGLLGTRSAIVARPPGYQLSIASEATDVEVAQRLIREGEQATELSDRVAALGAAVGLWRGQALVDVAGHPWFEQQAERLADLRLVALHGLVEARLDLGEHAQVLTELDRWADEYLYDERICRQLMIALYRAGRQADALARYQVLRRRLAEDLGLDPSPELRELEARILQQDDRLDRPQAEAPPAAGNVTAVDPPPAPTTHPPPVPAQLPPAVHGFAGREREVGRLDAVLAARADDPIGPPALVISAVSGTAGVGKTALAVHWAHRIAARYPDGQLYVNLRGFDPGGSVLEPAEVVRGFLTALGVPVEQIPTELEAQAALYRSALAGKQVLVVLDNARDVEQVRPLFPGTAGCLVVVTSRNQLSPLVAGEGAHLLTLDPLDLDGARELLQRRIGAERVTAEPAAIDDIIAACARLPLALAIAAARAAARPGFPLAALATDLRIRSGPLDGLDRDRTGIAVRDVFSWSYDAVGADAARLFRLLGLHPGPDISEPAAASLAGLPGDRLRPLLTELTLAHLLSEHSPGRYTFHDLLRVYAAERAHATDSDKARTEARCRMFDHYLHSAASAARGFSPQREHLMLPPPKPGVTAEQVAGHDAALAWFAAERPIILPLVTQADPAWDRHAWQLTWAFVPFLDRQGHWAELAAVLTAALAAAERIDDGAAQAYLHRSLGMAYSRLDSLDRTRAHNQRAIDLFAEVNDPVGEAHTWMGVAWLSYQLDGAAQCARDTRRALQLYQAAGHRVGEARALGNLGWVHVDAGEFDEALICCRQALAVHKETGDREGEATAWDSLGYAYHHSGDHSQAIVCYRHAIDLRRLLGDRYAESETLHRLGDTQRASGDPDSAGDAWRASLSILDELAHPDADQVRDKLGELRS